MEAETRQSTAKELKANLDAATKLKIDKTKIEVPSIKSLAQVYQLAVRRDDSLTAQAAEQAVLSLGRAEAAIAESTVLASFLDEV